MSDICIIGIIVGLVIFGVGLWILGLDMTSGRHF